MKEVTRRCFTMDDQCAFAALSGDANPVHVDPVAARRTMFGGCVVHGVHGLLWVLDSLAKELSSPRALASIDAKFLHAIVPGDEVSCRIESDGETWRGAIVRDGVEVTRVSGRWAEAEQGSAVSDEARECAVRERTFDDAAQASGETELWLDPAQATALFPALVRALPAAQLAALLATTRIVGMECPGLHSMFSSLRLSFSESNDRTLRWRASRADARFSSIEVTIDGAGVSGVLATFFRPPPKAQPTMAQLAEQVQPGEFAQHRVLIIGGSRGLGEVAAKLFAAGGAQVCITYARGVAEARRVCEETKASAVSWDVTIEQRPALPWSPTVLCYFATPHIAVDKALAFSPAKFARFSEFYVTGFWRVVERVLASGDDPFAVLYPSTIFLEKPEPNMAEYCAAKAAGEELCRQLARRFPRLRISAPRLPRVQTDQTIGLLPIAAESAPEVLLPVLRAL